MKKLMAVSLFGVGMLVLSGLSYAQGMPSSSDKSESGIQGKGRSMDKGVSRENEIKDSSMEQKRASGEVTAVDAKAGKLSVKTNTKELDLKVQGGSTKKSLDSIKVGDKVTVAYREQGANLVADSVRKSGTSSDSASSGMKSRMSSDSLSSTSKTSK